ncbi:MAG: (d)CMP kinase [Rhodospirillaceae bacterium]|nr:(d)CMP kinase [Rhodospirillaceae bacterium]MCA8931037.1 (d)CMP kinase [Rhodospirillaceae bacterium]
MIVAVDGPAASGKGTLGKRLAAELGLRFLDTGVLYRAVGLKVVRDGGDLDDGEAAAAVARSLDPDSLDDPDLRGDEAAEAASRVSSVPAVRAALLDYQRRFAATPPGAVLDGRDIGTVVCPEADHKLFVTADVEVRAERRYKELQGRGTDVIYAQILRDLRTRDERDSRRAVAPLVPADDAFILDTSTLTADEAFERAYAHIVGGGPRRRTRTETF